MTLPTGPYVGLMPYREEDAAFFFGREAEREIISANLMASRLTLLYGPSGVGKTSVLHAGVAHHLGLQSTMNLAPGGKPEYAVVVFGSWRDEPVSELLARVNQAVVRSLGRPVDPPAPSRSLASGLQAWTERLGGDLLIILDQFEEYFVYHEGEEGEGTWADELPAAVTQPDLRVNILISIREDALASLDQFKGRIPNLFTNYLRVEHLNIDAAREAIELPLEEFNRIRLTGQARDVRIESALVDAVLSQVEAGQVLAAQGGLGLAGATSGASAGRVRIEAPYLQLVMSRLWDEEMIAGSNVLRLETLERLGGAERIVRTHLDQALSTLPDEQQAVAASAFRYLVTPSGSKITHTLPDLAEYAGLTTTELSPVLRELSDPTVRVLRPVAPPPAQPATPRYEIFHDVLAAPILDWRRRFENAKTAKRLEREKSEAQEEAKRERRRARRFRSLSVGLIFLTLLTVVATVVALDQRNTAERRRSEAEQATANARYQERRAESEAFLTRAAAELPTNPLIALFLAVQAAEVSPDVNAADLMTQTLTIWATQGRSGGETPPYVTFSPDGSRLATVDARGAASLWDAGTGQRTAALENGGRVSGVAFSPDGTILATTDLSGDARIWKASSGDLIRTLPSREFFASDPLLSVAFSDDGQRLIAGTLQQGGVAIWDIRRSRLTNQDSGSGTAVFSAFFAWRRDISLALSSRGTVDLLWDPDGGDPGCGGQIYSRLLSNPTYGMALNADHTMLVTMNSGDLGGVWKLVIHHVDFGKPRLSLCPAGKLVAKLRGHKSPLTAAAFDFDARMVVTASTDGTARVWNATTGETLQVLSGHDGPLLDAAFDPEGKLVVTAGADGTARVWNASTGRQVRALRVTPSEVVILAAFSPDGSRILTVTGDGVAQVWNTGTGRVEFTLDS